MAVGSAYGFFRSVHSSLYVGEKLSGIRQGMLNGRKLEPEPNIPKELTLNACALWYISNGMNAKTFVFDAASGFWQLMTIAQEWKGKGANYFMWASLPGATDAKVADALVSVMSILYDDGILAGRTKGDFELIVDVYYKKQDGSYVSARLEPPGAG